MPHEHGWYYHFVDMRTGARVWECELSSIDTALLLAGALTAGSYFGGEVEALADDIYARVDFPWMLTDGGQKPDSTTLCHGWKPELGFLPSRWDSYSEHMVLYLLAIGSPTRPIPAATWDAWDRPEGEYGATARSASVRCSRTSSAMRSWTSAAWWTAAAETTGAVQ